MSNSILAFNRLYRDLPVVHYYPDPLSDTRRIWIASELHKAFSRSNNILDLMITDKAENDKMFTYAVKTKLLLTFFEQHEHNNRLPDEQFGSQDCICFDEGANNEYSYVDRSKNHCKAHRHFGDFFLSRLQDNVRDLKDGRSIASKESTKDERLAHLIEGILNSEGDDFAGTVPFDAFYIVQELMPDVLKLNTDEMRTLADEKHTCLASKITATFVLLVMHGILTRQKTNLLSYIPIHSEWMIFIMKLILAGGEEEISPDVDSGYFPNYYVRRISSTFTGCAFDCHIAETSDAILTPAVNMMKILPDGLYLHTALNALKDSIFCDCAAFIGRRRKRVIMLDQFESTIAHVRGYEGKDFSVHSRGHAFDDASTRMTSGETYR